MSVAATKRQWVSFVALLAITALIAFLFFRILTIFILPLFLALVLVIIFHPIFELLLYRCGGRRWLAAMLTTLGVVLVVLLPTLLLLWLSLAEALSMTTQIGLGTIPHRVQQLRRQFRLDMPYESQIRRVERMLMRGRTALDQGQLLTPDFFAGLTRALQQLDEQLLPADKQMHGRALQAALAELQRPPPEEGGELDEESFWVVWRNFYQFRTAVLGGPAWQWVVEAANPSDEQRRLWRQRLTQFIQSYILPLGGATAIFLGKMLIGSVIVVVAVFFFFYDGPNMWAGISRISPLEERYERELVTEFTAMSRTVVLATLVSAVAQGALAGIGFWLLGFQSTFLLTSLTILCAIIPFVGASAVWLPCVLWLYFVEERSWAAFGLFVYGALVVSLVDNIIKPWILHGQTKLHPLLALLSVLGGVHALGAMGVIVGPVTVVCLQTALKILHRELMGGRIAAQTPPSGAPSTAVDTQGQHKGPNP